MNEYKKLLVLQSALFNFEGTKIPMNIIVENINPLNEYIKNRLYELENESKNHTS